MGENGNVGHEKVIADTFKTEDEEVFKIAKHSTTIHVTFFKVDKLDVQSPS